MNIEANLEKIKKEIPAHVKLVLVSKNQDEEHILRAYRAGQKVLGENKAQEISAKQPHLPPDIEWHFIGHLQRNKVKYLAPFVSLIHSIDSFKLLKEINKEALKNERNIDCLLEFHIASEESKYGLTYDKALSMLQIPEYKELKNVNICGVMGMATFTDNESQVRSEFKSLYHIYNELKKNFFADNPAFKEISMGMSDDYHIAIEEGSTMVRIGTAIFS